MLLPALDAYRLWAETYDSDPNPLLALESRIVEPLLGPLEDATFLDAGCGTGRWLDRTRCARSVGVDVCFEMLALAAEKQCSPLIQADILHLPIASRWASIVLSSFTLSYAADVRRMLAELARVAAPGAIIAATDIHPQSLARGWQRTFQHNGVTHQIETKPYEVRDVLIAGRESGLNLIHSVDAPFGEPERSIFCDAGREDLFHAASETPALLALVWKRT